ncbi:MAG: MobA/MobL family protein [Sphingopyxis sp.]|nr:MobA/MobL family protein [Sphingopyxis sp.]
MAIYHLSVKVISRATGRSAVAAAAYRSAARLHDARLERDHDFTNKAGVVHSAVLLPEQAPEAWRDREQLWNAVEAAEKRKDAQLAREVEFAIPRELNQAQGIALARDFVNAEFVSEGMIADLNVHWDIGADGLAKPHAHVMLTMREVVVDEAGEPGFGAKVRDWNSVAQINRWRERWAAHVNARLAELDIDARIDHRRLAEQGITLEPQDKIGPAASRRSARGLEAERLEVLRGVGRDLLHAQRGERRAGALGCARRCRCGAVAVARREQGGCDHHAAADRHRVLPRLRREPVPRLPARPIGTGSRRRRRSSPGWSR